MSAADHYHYTASDTTTTPQHRTTKAPHHHTAKPHTPSPDHRHDPTNPPTDGNDTLHISASHRAH